MTLDEADESEKPPDPSAFGVYYARLLHQQNMLQDTVRTQTYRHAIIANAADFDGKIVLDVGSGTGILAFFAAQAGAGRVYAVEASAMGHITAEAAWAALDENVRLHVLKGRVEDVVIPEHVDVIISEPLGFLLVHERMLEAYIAARDRFLRPGGRMMPSNATIKVVPVTDAPLWNEQRAKAAFWDCGDFYGVDLTALRQDALDEYFSQAVVGCFSPDAMLCQQTADRTFDFHTVTLTQLRDFTIPLDWTVNKTAVCHGLGCWFDTAFCGSAERVILSTGPAAASTHWYQCRLLFQAPIAVNASQRLVGSIRFAANDRLSYDLHVELRLDGTEIKTTQHIRLDDQMYHYLQGPPHSN
ncbi:S-adenosyl-L-methionine-dependent methyltransferase [Pelagophyceae sp. CCMP2097]|nr:S-adenosyl-L-methionine-dependent methyltransferase [Pelagophyceae sp. CCMP2097]